MRILLAEDERELSRALETILRHEHYAVDTVFDGQDALDYGCAQNYDGIILDIMMPVLDGVEVLRRLRAAGVRTPAMFLTAKSLVTDRISGLDAGADDYLTKPFAMGEFVARVRALTRRGAAYSPDLLAFGSLTLDRASFTLSFGENSVRLGSKEFQIMELLMRARGSCIPSEQFLERVWGYDSEVDLNVVWVYISYLRRKLARLGADTRIASNRGRGYLLETGKRGKA